MDRRITLGIGEFLDELLKKVGSCSIPILIVGDFNLVRRSENKSNENINWPTVSRFNDAIASLSLRELNHAGRAGRMGRVFGSARAFLGSARFELGPQKW
jgi:hypothetical protein